jgi:uncharacterized protein with NRDE domain
MCLIIFAHRVSAQYPLLIAANRDEYHQRPTTGSSFWPDHPQLLAGRDEQLGGTWMGITRTGRFAAVTNFRDPAASTAAPRSRGELPLNFLTGTLSTPDYLAGIVSEAGEYAGFNLLLGEPGSLWYFSNSGEQQGPVELSPGIYGLSNASLDTPWTKVTRGKTLLSRILEVDEPISHDHLLGLVNNKSLAQPEQLEHTGLESEMEQLLSAQFIQSESYGTRSSTTLWQNSDGLMNWREISYDPQGQVIGQTLEAFEQN